ncbi:hypothetical protein GUJ93_ZPchr0013g36920, partial [Zizania palustris]
MIVLNEVGKWLHPLESVNFCMQASKDAMQIIQTESSSPPHSPIAMRNRESEIRSSRLVESTSGFDAVVQDHPNQIGREWIQSPIGLHSRTPHPTAWTLHININIGSAMKNPCRFYNFSWEKQLRESFESYAEWLNLI